VKHTSGGRNYGPYRVEDTIHNGVKETIDLEMDDEDVIEYMIETGVKETIELVNSQLEEVEDTIQNGVKNTQLWLNTRDTVV
jgi:hypothetical protein